MKKKDKFDAVANMRRLRDELSRKIENMSFEEEKQFLKEALKNENETEKEAIGGKSEADYKLIQWPQALIPSPH